MVPHNPEVGGGKSQPFPTEKSEAQVSVLDQGQIG